MLILNVFSQKLQSNLSNLSSFHNLDLQSSPGLLQYSWPVFYLWNHHWVQKIKWILKMFWCFRHVNKTKVFIPSANALPSDLKSCINSFPYSWDWENVQNCNKNRISWSIFISFICLEMSFWKFNSNFFVVLPAPILIFKWFISFISAKQVYGAHQIAFY